MSPEARFRRGLLKYLYFSCCHSIISKNRQIGTSGVHFYFPITLCGNSRLDDMQKYLSFAKLYIEMLERNLIENIMMVQIECIMKCGKTQKDTEPWSMSILKEKAEQILVPCQKPCDYAIEFYEQMACKPVSVKYCRINEIDEKYQGKMDLKLTYDEIKGAN